MLPPINPINNNFNQSFFLNKVNSLNLVVKNSNDNKNNETVMFFAKVNILESMPVIPYLFINIEIPLIIAVEHIKSKYLFFILKSIKTQNLYKFCGNCFK